MSNFGRIGSDWSFDRIKAKLDKGQFLSDAEAAYLESEAKVQAERILAKDKTRGAAFQLLVAKALNVMAEHAHESERKQKGLPPTNPMKASDLFDEGGE